MNPPINIIDYRVTEISVKQNSDFDKKIPLNPVFDVSTDISGIKKEAVSRLKMTIKQKKTASNNQPYNIKLIIEGLFRYKPDIEQDFLDELLQLNANSILYGLARGTVSQTTATMTDGKFLLPTVSFYNSRYKRPTKTKKK